MFGITVHDFRTPFIFAGRAARPLTSCRHIRRARKPSLTPTDLHGLLRVATSKRLERLSVIGAPNVYFPADEEDIDAGEKEEIKP